MKNVQRFILLILALGCLEVSLGQTFTGTGGTIPNIGSASFPINVSGVGVIDMNYGVSSVCININHATPGRDLEIVLMAPDGTSVPLSMQNGTGGHFTNTCFSATAATSIHNGTSPFTGTFVPDAYLGTVNNGQNADATWRLLVNDRRNNSGTGSLLNWSITFNNTPAPQPPPVPACSVTLPSGTSCDDATMICDFSGLCGNTSGSTVNDWSGSNLNNCFGLENNTFLKFVAASTSATFSVWVPTYTASAYINSGIQMIFFEGTCGSGSVTPLGCYPHILAYGDPTKPVANIVTATGLTPGNTYYLMIDGYGGDHCDFIVETTQEINEVNVSPANPSICSGQSVTLTATGSGGTYNWLPATGLSATTGASVIATPSVTTTYTVTSIMNGVCPATTDVTVTVNDAPIITTQPSVVTQSVCSGGTTSPITIAASTSSGTLSYQWYSNTTPSNSGGTLLTGETASTLLPQNATTGTLYYYCVISVDGGCSISSNVSGAITIKPLPQSPTATITQLIDCINTTATVTIQSPLGITYQYSSGGPFQSSTVFSGLNAGNVSFTVKDLTTGCTSTATTIIIPNSTESVGPPTINTTQPGCGQVVGSISITSPLGANYEYSTGGAYQPSPDFGSLVAATYLVTVKDVNSGCISTPVSVNINPGPATPALPNAYASHQPDCTNASGTIVVTSPVNPNHEYAVNGVYQSSPTFTGLTPGMYSITVRNIITGCESEAANILINNIPPPPPAAVVNITAQPTCATPTGTFEITTPTGTYTYSIDGATYQSATTFSGLTPGSYTVYVKNADGCVSQSSPVVINPPSGAPPVPTATITTAPTCTTPVATIAIASPTGADIQYSMGSGYQMSPLFSGVAVGTYQVTAMSISTGCISGALVINVVPATAPAPPLAAVTAQPVCNNPNGEITITSPIGANFEYSIGGAYQLGVTFSVPVGSYNITVRDNSTGCISNPTAINMAASTNVPDAPLFAQIQQPTCTNQTGSIEIASPLGANLSYSVGGGYQSGTVFSNLSTGTYSVTVKDNSTGCVSAATQAVIDGIPMPPASPNASISNPDCSSATGSVTVTSPLGSLYSYSIGGAFQTSVVFNQLAPGAYSLTVKNTQTECVSPPTTIVIADAPTTPEPPVSQDVTHCGPGSVVLQATGTGTIRWYSDPGLNNEVNEGNGFNVNISNTTTYYLTADFGGCVSDVTEMHAVVIPNPAPFIGRDTSICPGEKLVLTPGSYASYLWSTGSHNPSITITSGGIYTVTVTSAAGCTGQGSVSVSVIDNCTTVYFPKAFTPNSDFLNDGFGPLPRNIYPRLKDYRLSVYNRYGQMVFTSSDPWQRWDGSFGGRYNPGTFTWYCAYTFNGKKQLQKGTVVVLK